VNPEVILFWAFAVCTLLSAAVVVTARSPMTSAMSLVATFFFLAGIYVLLWAHTIAVLQVLVYAGAIMVLFLFVIMLLSLTDAGPPGRVTISRIIGGAASFGLLTALVVALTRLKDVPDDWTKDPSRVASFGSLATMGDVVYKVYLLPFEAVSLLLLVAIVGAVVVAKSRI
jgi:NADH-quinone oxidoreductase subunit J